MSAHTTNRFDEDIAVGLTARGAPTPTPRNGRRRARRLLGRLLLIAVAIGIWWLITKLEIWDSLILPSPAAVWKAFIQSVTVHDGVKGFDGYYLWQHLWASLWRILQGVFWAIAFGIPLGLLLGTVRSFRFAVEPFVHFVRSLPPLAYFSLLIIWFGIDNSSKVWLLFLAAFAPIAIATMVGVETVSHERVNAARSLGASRRQVAFMVLMPSAAPDIFTGIRLAVGFAWTTIVAAETANGLPGIGGLAWDTTKQLRTDIAILCVIVIGITALVLDSLLRLVERVLIPWRGKG